MASIQRVVTRDEARFTREAGEEAKKMVFAARVCAAIATSPSQPINPVEIAKLTKLTESTVREVLSSDEFRVQIEKITKTRCTALVGKLMMIHEDNVREIANIEEVALRARLTNETLRSVASAYEKLARASDSADGVDSIAEMQEVLSSMETSDYQEQRTADNAAAANR